ncbi:MAG: phage major capsid protein [Lachnospiraceae bacterium]|nr:phage major capsid protein [Lachnospiraceae bacterium]
MTIAQMRALLQQRKAEQSTNDARLSQIETEVRGLQNDDAGMARLRELQTEVDGLEERRSELDTEIRALETQIDRMETMENMRSGRVDLTPIEQRTTSTENMTVEQVRASEEYRFAWLRSIARDADNNPIFGALTDAEKRAFTFMTTNSSAVVPTITQNRIVDRLRHEAPMLEDAEVTAITQGFAIPVRTMIDAGDAAVVAQDAANEDEQDTFTLITMVGVDIKKHATMTRRMQFQSIEAFEDWLVADISKRIMVAKEKVIIARLDGTAPATGESVNASVKIDAGNVLTAQKYTDEAIRKIMAKIEEPGQVVVYANRYTIFNGLAGIEDGAGHKAFITTPQDDPMIKGVIYGGVVKEDVNLTNNVAYFGVRGAVKANNFAPLEITPSIEPRTANRIFTGSEIFDAGLENPKAFVKVTFSD